MRQEERRLVTCLFIDVVGSTELTVSLGPERLKAALDGAFSGLRALIEREGGTVEKYVGDAIYAIFGSPVAHSDDPLRALRAAAGARDWASGRAAIDVPFAVRVGVETGEAIVDLAAATTTRQQLSVGAVVNTAARLQQRAEPGQVLVGPVTHEATADAATFTPLGHVELKGIGSLEIHELVEVRASTRRDLPFVGRDGELELLRVAYGRAQRGRSVLALVSGPPGQGKTRLVREFIASLGPVKLAQARCRPGGEVGTLAPIRELLLGTSPDDELEQIVAAAIDDRTERVRVAEVLAHSAGIRSSAALASLGADERSDEIANAWTRYLRGLASGGPLVLWIEDVHWAAPDVVRLLDRISRSGVPVLVVATARPEFAEAAGIRPSGDRFFIELEGLDEGEARALARLVNASTERPVDRAGGNPLFILELARGSSEELPITLQGALGARLDELEPAERLLLAHGAVVGETFEAADVALLGGTDLAEAGRSLRRLLDLLYIDQIERRYRFHHSLLRDVAYGRLLVADRMRLHARYATAREGDADAEVLAHHWWAGLRPPDAEWVWRDSPELPAMRRAAQRAHIAAGRHQGELFATDQAVALLERALLFADDPRDRAGIEYALGDAFATNLRGDESWLHYLRALDAHREAGTVPAEAYLGPLKVRTRYGAFRQRPDAEDVDALKQEAEARARSDGDPGTLARILAFGAFEDRDPGGGSGDTVALEEAVQLANASGDRETRREVLGWYANTLIGRFDLDRAAALLEEVGTLGTPSDQDEQERLRGLGVVALRMGDLAALERIAATITSLSSKMGPHLRTHAGIIAAMAALTAADWPRLERLARATSELIHASPTTAFCASAASTLAYGAMSHAAHGRPEEARALARDFAMLGQAEDSMIVVARSFALALAGDTSPLPVATLWSAPMAGVAAVIRGDRERAAAIVIEMRAAAGGGARFYAALAEAIEEELERDVGGPEPRHALLLEVGYRGWSELVRRRVDAEY